MPKRIQLTDAQKRTIINKCVKALREVPFNNYAIGFDVSGELFFDMKIITRLFKQNLEEKL